MSSIKLIAVGLSVIVTVALLFFVRSDLLSVKSLEVVFDKVLCADSWQIKDASAILGQNFFLISSSKVENNLKNKFLCIASVKISKGFPDKVTLEVSGREPAAIITVLETYDATSSATIVEEKGANFVVDWEGLLYSKDEEGINAPKIYVSGKSLSLGQKLDKTYDLLKILDKLGVFGLDIKAAKIYSNKDFWVDTMPKIIFKQDSNIDVQLASLQLILEQAKIDEKVLEFIDLRFDKPVVKFAPNKNGKR